MMPRKRLPFAPEKPRRQLSNILWLWVCGLLFLLVACGTGEKQPTPTLDIPTGNISELLKYSIHIPGQSITATDPREVASQLFGKWLDHFVNEVTDPATRLLDYRIISVELEPAWQVCTQARGLEFIATIIYSVQTGQEFPSDWWAGTGTDGEDQWINEKLETIGVFIDSGTYSFKIIGAPPCPYP